MSSAEVHGLASGLLAGGVADAADTLIREVLEDQDPADALAAECAAALRGVVRMAAAGLDDDEFGFVLCLPDDAQPLRHRAEGIRDWCRGFLYGMGLAGGTVSDDGVAVLQDIGAIARLEHDSIAESESEEHALAEIEEYLRVAAMSFREGSRRKPPGPDDVTH